MTGEHYIEPEAKGQLLIRTIAMPADTNPRGDIFGGWIVSQMDLAGLGLAQATSNSRATTVSIDKMVFLKPVVVGDFICCHGELLKVGKTSMQIKIEVFAISQGSKGRQQVTEGVFTYVAINDDGRPMKVLRDS
jgi:acyl-CoA thioesterase YciA